MHGGPLVSGLHTSLATGRAASGIFSEQAQTGGGAVFLLAPGHGRRDLAAQDEGSTASKRSFADAVREEPIVANAHEVRGQDVEHEAAGELGAGQGEDLGAVAVCAVAPAEDDLCAVVVEDAGVGEVRVPLTRIPAVRATWSLASTLAVAPAARSTEHP
jgi:hypothetical protein